MTRLGYFSAFEYALLGGSVTLILASFWLFGGTSYLSLAASLVGVTSLLFTAKGHPVGQALMVLFSLLYGVISFRCAYWGEMLTYLGMTMPMAAVSLVAWLRHPYRGRRAEVAVGRLTARGYTLMALLSAAVTLLFFFILRAWHTPNLLPSTLSVTTSFAAVYLTARRSPYYALAYAANDIILILLWVLAARTDLSYIPVAVCFMVFLVNDLYGFVGWRRMARRQSVPVAPTETP